MIFHDMSSINRSQATSIFYFESAELFELGRGRPLSRRRLLMCGTELIFWGSPKPSKTHHQAAAMFVLIIRNTSLGIQCSHEHVAPHFSLGK